MKRYIGVMSGTSCDGIDVCMAGVSFGKNFCYEIIETGFYPYGKKLREDILKLILDSESGSNSELFKKIISLDYSLGETYADAVSDFMKKHRITRRSIEAIGLHGQTVYHLSKKESRKKYGMSIQLGEPAFIKNKTGIPVVYDFRTDDILRGGEGAPLVPVVDRLLFNDFKKPVATLNIGGIANITIIYNKEDLTAFDTGPGNTLMDLIMETYPRNRLHYDKEGKLSKKGSVIEPVLKKWLKHPYINIKPPKSTGREVFGKEFIELLPEKYPIEDALRTAVEYTVETIYMSVMSCPGKPPHAIYVSGGGVRNTFLMERLKERFGGISIKSIADIGIDPDFKEAFSFAVLAALFRQEIKINMKNITGNPYPTKLGRIVN